MPFCTVCGKELPEVAAFCTTCAAKVGEAAPAQPTDATEAPAAVQPLAPLYPSSNLPQAYPAQQGYYPAPQQQGYYPQTVQAPPGTKAVNKLAYGLCGIFLGSLGVHKFLAGKIGLGVVYLLFCWTGIPALVGLIEGIIGLTKESDAYGNIYL
ncbi:MAG: NINE protein [Oscillospiraceae bacterium]|jgi:TM2 domain-containing membrane protein YozV|nr:NINE protein [Oscillospiraceae bacterium]